MADSTQKSKKPHNTAFRQQRLRAWQPILTPKTVLPTFFIIGIIFAPIGGLLLYSSNVVVEIAIDYTSCAQANVDYVNLNSQLYSIQFPGTNSSLMVPRYKSTAVQAADPVTGVSAVVQRCTIEFPVPIDMQPPVYLYYRLDNFYQNHRKYVKSFDADQLKGVARTSAQLQAGNCVDMYGTGNSVYYPCGFIANSVFNDTLYNLTSVVFAGQQGTSVTYGLSDSNIAWNSDVSRYGPTAYTDLSSALPPPNWQLRYPNGQYTAQLIQQVSTDQHLMVWMRTAGLPNFRKLWSKNTTNVLAAGVYSIDVDMRFNVTSFGGKKAIVLSTAGFLGGRNPFLGISYIAVGIICVLLGCIFTARHLYKPRKLGDHNYLSWNQQSVTESISAGTPVVN